ncbi:hypothetical protein F4801DRAFT_477240 [Xylaria longipes]|nr:hypothetical protein F4801DRAFT_477240 [Xylaria longipes]
MWAFLSVMILHDSCGNYCTYTLYCTVLILGGHVTAPCFTIPSSAPCSSAWQVVATAWALCASVISLEADASGDASPAYNRLID